MQIRFKENMKPENNITLRCAMTSLPEVLECYTLTRTNDAIPKVVVRDQRSLKEFMERLAASQGVIKKVCTAIVLEEIKVTTKLPLCTGRTEV